MYIIACWTSLRPLGGSRPTACGYLPHGGRKNNYALPVSDVLHRRMTHICIWRGQGRAFYCRRNICWVRSGKGAWAPWSLQLAVKLSSEPELKPVRRAALGSLSCDILNIARPYFRRNPCKHGISVLTLLLRYFKFSLYMLWMKLFS